MSYYGEDFWQSILAFLVVVAILGWALLEGLIYLFNHISISWIP